MNFKLTLRFLYKLQYEEITQREGQATFFFPRPHIIVGKRTFTYTDFSPLII